jgi:hypothetical protein
MAFFVGVPTPLFVGVPTPLFVGSAHALFRGNRSVRFPHPPIGQALRPAPAKNLGGLLLLVDHASAAGDACWWRFVRLFRWGTARCAGTVPQFCGSVVLSSFPIGFQDVRDCLAMRIARILTPDS